MSDHRKPARIAAAMAADERLATIAREAWAKWPGANDAGARRDYVTANVRGEPLWTLIKEYERRNPHEPRVLMTAVGILLNSVKPEDPA